MSTDHSRPRPDRRLARAGHGACAALLSFWLAACGTAPTATADESTTPAVAPVPPVPPPAVTPVHPPPVDPPQVLDARTPPVPDVLTALLTYAERLRALGATELAAEIVVQGDPGNAPLRQMQLALALAQTQAPADTARALGLAQRVVAHPGTDSVPLKPLARLLVNRLMVQRRLEDTADRQAQQLRDAQRRIEQLSDRLEAMRAIERSLTTRPPVNPPNGGARPSPP
ncbi:hypothetical protein [Hydrogenophaga sp.]|uniref:hypothetical protein n=1 Tax=Hydrogenophaga sp. TaxID=1904254 RepID=UPI003D131130